MKNHNVVCDDIWSEMGVLCGRSKVRKYLKVGDVRPVFGVYKGFVVIVRRGCGRVGCWEVKIFIFRVNSDGSFG